MVIVHVGEAPAATAAAVAAPTAAAAAAASVVPAAEAAAKSVSCELCILLCFEDWKVTYRCWYLMLEFL